MGRTNFLSSNLSQEGNSSQRILKFGVTKGLHAWTLFRTLRRSTLWFRPTCHAGVRKVPDQKARGAVACPTQSHPTHEFGQDVLLF